MRTKKSCKTKHMMIDELNLRTSVTHAGENGYARLNLTPCTSKATMESYSARQTDLKVSKKVSNLVKLQTDLLTCWNSAGVFQEERKLNRKKYKICWLKKP